MDSFKIEICANSVESGIQAEIGGADRIELCENLAEGGTTPSIGMIQSAIKNLKILVNVIVRPRGGDFCYSDIEFEIMKNDIIEIKKLNANSVVIGILTPDGNVDIQRCIQLVELARPMEVVFHRAFDRTQDPFKALEDIINIGFDRILTSGLQPTALLGKNLIAEIIAKAGDRISIMPGSGVNENNIAEIYETTKAKEFHMSLRKVVDGQMIYRSNQLKLSSSSEFPEFGTLVTEATRVKKVREILNQF